MTTYTAKDRIRIMDARYRKEYNYRRYLGIPTSLVPADEARAHVNRLLDLGWSSNALEQMADNKVSSTGLLYLAQGRHATIERKTQAAVLGIPYTLAPTPTVDDTAHIHATRTIRAHRQPRRQDGVRATPRLDQHRRPPRNPDRLAPRNHRQGRRTPRTQPPPSRHHRSMQTPRRVP